MPFAPIGIVLYNQLISVTDISKMNVSTRRQSSAEFTIWKAFLMAILSLFSGASLIAAILFKANLGVVLLALAGLITVLVFVILKVSTNQARKVARKRATIGVIAGGLGTLAYDVFRLLLVKGSGWTFNPFKAFPLFGKLLIGDGYSPGAIMAAGTAYHVLNGVLFAVAYSFIAAERPWYWGVAWALVLESAMFTLYPGWLDLTAVMKEFTVVSLSGHVVYGSVVGVACQRLAARQER